jgi:molybdenum-dependent DNA-binding transcriptional regulator ModE
MLDRLFRHFILPECNFDWEFGIMALNLEKVGKEMTKIAKTLGASYKSIDKDVAKLVEKLGESAGAKAGGGAGGGGGDMEAKVKKVQEQMKEMADLSDEIQKSVTEITKNMDK